MKAIKALVFFMGFLLVAGIGLLGYGMYSKAGRSVKAPAVIAPAGVPVAAPVDLAGFGGLGLDQPAGTRIAAARVSGTILVVELTDGGRADRVALVDLAGGSLLGMVYVDAAAAAPEAPTAE